MKKKSGWTLFLDRDGVLNHRISGNYVKHWNEFKFLPNVLTSLKLFNNLFDHIIIVTNQQGIAKGLMTLEDLNRIHSKARKIIRKHGGRIDKIYSCIELANAANYCRKPAMGMGLDAKKDFPAIDFNKSVMVGDSASDIEFGKNLGMKTIQILHLDSPLYPADFSCRDLKEFYRIFVHRILD